MASRIRSFKSLTEFQAAQKAKKLSVVDFTAKWCPPCKVISPIFEGYSGEDQFKDVDFYKVDVDDQSDIAEFVGIKAMPTFLFLYNDKDIDPLKGAQPEPLKTKLIDLLAKTKVWATEEGEDAKPASDEKDTKSVGVQVLSGEENFDKMKNEKKVHVLDFWADWCGPCKAISPSFKKFSEDPKYKDFGFHKVNVDEEPEIASKAGISAMPTFKFYYNGQELKDDKVTGAVKAKLEKSLDSVLERLKEGKL